ncbi:hypothetical protein HNP84_004829 [Thermocatellispora tengchongensis]|uniref:Uncharacterized protein n=1 Tax=Thermocatellispora tengchongensis TaxID=1073253 RepID=A0A840PAY1_9ACTN|nr:hypothetical protein [Thermocatellispora tengchongensis]MBB5135093.1 hypothetical protein [Thermocatellispora tengchongensis]
MRKVRALLVSALLATGLLWAAAAPAHAEPTIRYVYVYYSDCLYGGQFGINAGWWTSFSCVYQTWPGSTEGRYFLYA